MKKGRRREWNGGKDRKGQGGGRMWEGRGRSGREGRNRKFW